MGTTKTFVLFLFTLLVFSAVHAEYRAFQLEIEDLETGQTRKVASTMDHLQYATYYPLKKTETIRYVDSWMCWGRTNLRPICPNINKNTQP